MNTIKQRHHTFICVSGLALLAILIPACDLDGGEDLSDIDEQAARDAESLTLPDAQGVHGVPAVMPDPADVWIESITAFGAGCPDMDSTEAELSPDKKSVFISFEDMLLQNPGGSPVKTTNCTATIKVHVPSGWQFAFRGIRGRGVVALGPGMKARRQTSYFLAGDPADYKANAEFTGPQNKRYVLTDQIPPESAVWSACGGSGILVASTALVLNAIANPAGYASFDARKLDLFELQWKPC